LVLVQRLLLIHVIFLIYNHLPIYSWRKEVILIPSDLLIVLRTGVVVIWNRWII